MARQSSHARGHLERIHRFRRLRESGEEIDYFRLIDCTVELPETEGTSQEAHAPNHKPLRLAGSKVGPQK